MIGTDNRQEFGRLRHRPDASLRLRARWIAQTRRRFLAPQPNGDWRSSADGPLLCPFSLLTGNFTGNFVKSCLRERQRLQIMAPLQGFRCEFPTQWNRELFSRNREFLRSNREILSIKNVPGSDFCRDSSVHITRIAMSAASLLRHKTNSAELSHHRVM